MKKWISTLLIFAMLLTLAACSLKSDQKDKTDPAEDDRQTADIQPEVPDVPAIPTEPDAPAIDPDQPTADPGDDREGDGEPLLADEEGYVIRISHTDVTLKTEGETFRLTVRDSNGDGPDTCTYTSASPEIASVDEAVGEVTAVAPGTTTVTAHVTFGGEERDLECIVRCRWDVEEAPEVSVPVSGEDTRASLSGFFATLQGQYDGLGSLMVLDGELLDNYYPGLSGIASVEEILIQETATSMANVAVGMVKLSAGASKDDVMAVQSILNERIRTQADGGAWYPASCETWGEGVVTSTANVVGMFVYPDDAQKMADQFILTFGN